MEGVDVEFVVEVADHGFGFFGGVFEDVGLHGLEGFGVHPADHEVDVVADVWLVVFADDHVAAADVDVVFELHDGGHGWVGFGDGAVGGFDGGDFAGESAREDFDFVAGFEDAS